MQSFTPIDSGTVAGTFIGTMACIICTIHLDDILQTAILATIGAIVSFIVSLALKYILRRLHHKRST